MNHRQVWALEIMQVDLLAGWIVRLWIMPIIQQRSTTAAAWLDYLMATVKYMQLIIPERLLLVCHIRYIQYMALVLLPLVQIRLLSRMRIQTEWI